MREERGFTLIELLVVVAIIGILAAIGIPQYADYKIRSYNSTAQSMLHDIITLEEAYYVDHESYAPDLMNLNGNNVLPLSSTNIVVGVSNVFPGGMFCAPPPPTGAGEFYAYAYHPAGNVRYCFDSTTGHLTHVDGIETPCFAG